MMWLAVVLSMYLQSAPPVTVVFETGAGNFEVSIDVAHAPVTAANFLKYVDDGAYDTGAFHRTVRPETETNTTTPIQVIQASRARGTQGYPAIALERTSVTGIAHRAGTLSMARAAAPDSASSDFFICVTDTPALDFAGARNPDGQGFAAFGHVVSGMDVIVKIQQSPVAPGTQNLAPRISITKAYRKK